MAQKRILVDARMVGAVGHGIGNYVLDLADAIAAKPRTYALEFLVGPDFPANQLPNAVKHKTDISFLHPFEMLSLSAVIEEIGPDLYHTPSFSSLPRYPCPHVQTVHDLNHLQYGSFLQKIYYRTLLLPSIKKAKAVTTVSGSARSEIKSWLARLGVEKEISVAPNVIRESDASTPGTLEKFGLKSKGYFFCLSNAKPHKNLDLLEKAYLGAKSNFPLVMSVIGESQNGIVRTGPLNPGEVQELLKHAHTFFFPSLYEGFGRPPVEAALAGVRPVAANIPVLREALSGVAESIFMDPNNQDAWTRAFQQAEMVTVSEKSRAWIRREYSLERLAEVMDRVYLGALDHK